MYKPSETKLKITIIVQSKKCLTLFIVKFFQLELRSFTQFSDKHWCNEIGEQGTQEQVHEADI